MKERKRVIISRHRGAIQFIKEELPEFEKAIVMGTATEEDLKGAIVVGNLPINLAAEAFRVFPVLFKGNPPRGQEYTADEMREAGAYIGGPYVVMRQSIPNN